MITVVDTFGIERDISKQADVKYPIAHVEDLAVARTEFEPNKNLVPIVEHSRAFDTYAEIYDEQDDSKVNYRIDIGKGITYSPSGASRKVGIEMDNNSRHSQPTYINGHSYRFYVVFLCIFKRKFLDVYMSNKDLEVNHLIIPQEGAEYPVRFLELFEIVNQGLNKGHKAFVKRWDLFGCPVSAFDRSRLESIYQNNGVSDVLRDPAQAPILTNIEDAFTNPDAAAAKRRLLTWWYFLKQHTSMDDNMWTVFREYLESEFAGDLPANGDIAAIMDNYFTI